MTLNQARRANLSQEFQVRRAVGENPMTIENWTHPILTLDSAVAITRQYQGRGGKYYVVHPDAGTITDID